MGVVISLEAARQARRNRVAVVRMPEMFALACLQVSIALGMAAIAWAEPWRRQ